MKLKNALKDISKEYRRELDKLNKLANPAYNSKAFDRGYVLGYAHCAERILEGIKKGELVNET